MKLPILVLSVALFGAGCASETTVTVPAPVSPAPVEAPIVEEGSAIELEADASAKISVPVTEAPAEEATQTQSPPAAQEQPQAQTPEPQEEIVTVVARFSGFEPSQIRVKEGTRIALRVISIDAAHTYTLPGYGINLPLSPGVTQAATFVANKKGTFPFRCDFHPSMAGTLIVE